MEVTNNLIPLGIFKDFSDGTLKSVFDVGKKQIIEVTLQVNNDSTDVVYMPTAYSCSFDCELCNETKSIDTKNFIEALIKSVMKQTNNNTLIRRTDNKKLLISFMGVEESDLNLKLMEEVYNNEPYLKEVLGYEKIGYAISTNRPTDIVKLTEFVYRLDLPFKLQFFLNIQTDRDSLKFIQSNKISVEETMESLVTFKEVINSNPNIMEKYTQIHRTNDLVEIHYTLIENINDDEKTINILSGLLENYNIPIKFVKFNLINDLPMSNKEQLFISEIQKKIPNLKIETYFPPGLEFGSFGRYFTKHYCHEETKTPEQKKEFDIWKRKYQIFEKNREEYLSWDEYFMAVAKLSSMRSKDPSTQVGACIVGPDNRILSIGYNGTPNGFEDEAFPWDREGNPLDTKYLYVCHGEMNAILNYRGSRKELEGAKIYVDLFPCNECAKLIIQSGIKEVIYLSDKYADTDSVIASKKLFHTCDVIYRQLPDNSKKTITIKLKDS